MDVYGMVGLDFGLVTNRAFENVFFIFFCVRKWRKWEFDDYWYSEGGGKGWICLSIPYFTLFIYNLCSFLSCLRRITASLKSARSLDRFPRASEGVAWMKIGPPFVSDAILF